MRSTFVFYPTLSSDKSANPTLRVKGVSIREDFFYIELKGYIGQPKYPMYKLNVSNVIKNSIM